MAQIIRPNLVPQRPAMRSEHEQVAQAMEMLTHEVRILTCRLNALAKALGQQPIAIPLKDDAGQDAGVQFGYIPIQPPADESKEAEA